MKKYDEPLTRADRTTLVSLLNRELGFSNPGDARNLIDRVKALREGGEWPEMILGRLNGPAQTPPDDVQLVQAEPAPSRATLSIVRPRPKLPPATPMRTPEREDLKCVPCGAFFSRIKVRGRKPTRCPACR